MREIIISFNLPMIFCIAICFMDHTLSLLKTLAFNQFYYQKKKNVAKDLCVHPKIVIWTIVTLTNNNG